MGRAQGQTGRRRSVVVGDGERDLFRIPQPGTGGVDRDGLAGVVDVIVDDSEIGCLAQGARRKRERLGIDPVVGALGGGAAQDKSHLELLGSRVHPDLDDDDSPARSSAAFDRIRFGGHGQLGRLCRGRGGGQQTQEPSGQEGGGSQGGVAARSAGAGRQPPPENRRKAQIHPVENIVPCFIDTPSGAGGLTARQRSSRAKPWTDTYRTQTDRTENTGKTRCFMRGISLSGGGGNPYLAIPWIGASWPRWLL